MQALMSPDDSHKDRRDGRRSRTFKGCRIVFNGGYSTFECTIKNISPSGALLRFGDVVGVPNRFELELEAGRPRKKCVVRWRSGSLMGVSFDDVG